ncbi:F0F1 ATP synthase subunit alpha [bacterium]|nr:F0F1 ATP synthase subunit alpha [bacterium]
MDSKKIVEKLKNQIKNFEKEIDITEIGTVLEIGDGIVKASGLDNCKSSEMVKFENGEIGIALNLEEETVGIIVLGDYTQIKEGQSVTRTGEILSIPVSDNFLGRIIDPLGEPIDGKGKIESSKNYLIEKKAPGVMEREPVSEPLQTGIKAIDTMIPIGKGQRELIIGDKQTGKTAIAIDTILNQKGKDVVCIYVSIGQKESKLARIISKLKEGDAMDYTIVISASASKPAAMSYIAPYSGATLAEYFMDKKKNVLVVYDDLTKQAWAYREISLLLRRPAGREAYPGDVFYLHSRLLERACRRNEKSGGGSITALPIIETQAGDVSAYIPTNVISITDGQIFLESNLFYKGIRPAINVGISVSRVGGSAQIKSMKKNAGKLKLSLAQFRELEAFTQFASDLDSNTKKQLDRGNILVEILKQEQYKPVEVSLQVALIYLANNGYLDNIKLEDIKKWETDFFEYMKNFKKDVLEKISKNWGDEEEKLLKNTIEEYIK